MVTKRTVFKLKHLFKAASDYRKQCICGPLFKLLEASFELCVPLVMKSMIDVGIANNDTVYIIKMALLLVLLGALGLTCTIIAQYFSAFAAVGIASKIKRSLLQKLQSLSFKDLDDIGTPAMITRMTGDANQVQSGINLTLRLLLRSPFVVFGAMLMAFTVDARSALSFAVVIPLLCVVVFGIMLICIPLYKRVQQRLERVLLLTRENLSGVRVIRAFCRETQETEEFSRRLDDLNREQNSVGKFSALMNPATYVLINFAVIALIKISAGRVYEGAITQGAVVSLYNYMLLILVELIKLANLIITMTRSAACENRIEAVLDMQPSQENPENALLPKEKLAVELKNVSLRYSDGVDEALSDISFRVEKGQTVGIIGGTGSGKSSLVNLIPRFYDATSGSVTVGGVDVKELSLQALRAKIGVVPQKAMLFAGTIKENLLWGNENATERDIDEALAASQSAEFVFQKPDGLNTVIGQGGKGLSGGQRQRLTIARALVRRPEILILDDSMSALDFATDAALRHAVNELPYKPTVFIVSQRTGSIMNADKIIVLDDGRAVGIGTHSQLLAECPVYREIHETQFKGERAQ